MRIALSLLLVTFGAALWASPTGLNNIPTADVAPKGVLVLQQYSLFAEGHQPALFAGAKYGLARNIEIGLDDRFAGDTTGSPVLQAKWRFLDNDARLSAAIGLANLGDHERNGDPAFYLALKRSVGTQVRGHVGHMRSGDDDALFLGLDGDMARTGGWVWRTDATQVNDGDDWLASIGTIGPLAKNALLEAWFSFSTAEDQDESFMLKLDWVIGK